MTFHLKTYPDSLRQLFVSCSVEEINNAFNQAVSTVQKNFSLPGYRKGKVPIEIISKSNPPELINIVSDLLMKKSYEYLNKENTSFYGQPRFNPMSGLSRDKEFLFSLVYEIYPAILEEPDLSKIEFAYESCELDQKFIEQHICRQIQIFDSVSGTIEEFDLVKVTIHNNDYKGDKKEAFFDANKLEILIGKKTGESLSIDFNDLSGYLPEFIGKTSNPLQIEITEISRAKDWSKVTDEEISEKTPFKTKNEYYEQNKLHFDELINQFNNTKKTESLTEILGSKIKTEMPKSLWLNNLKDLTIKTAEREIVKEDLSLNQLSDNKEISEKFAKLPLESVEGLSFIIWLDFLSEKEKISIDDNELEYYYYRYAQKKNIPARDIKKHLSSEEQTLIKTDAIREKTITHLLNTLTFKPKNTISLAKVIKLYGQY